MRLKHFHLLSRWMVALLLAMANEALAAPPAPRPFLNTVFADHMVLQREVAAPIWGWADPGTPVTVSMAGQSAKTVADAEGRWLAKLGPFPAGGPHKLTVAGPSTVTIDDVLVGDVWLCAGQSNMYFQTKNATGGEQEVANSNIPGIRLFNVAVRAAGEPLKVLSQPAQWQVASPETVKDFSAVAYFFGRHVHQNVNIPIGLIHASAGATTVEAWSSAEALKSVPGTEREFAAFEQWREHVIEWARYDADPAVYQKLMADWYLANDPGSSSAPGWADPQLSEADWKPINLPGNWHGGGLRGFEGVAWFRRSFDLPDELRSKDVVLQLGPMDRRDTVWVNGSKVGQSDSNGWVRQYNVGAKLLKPLGNRVVVRVLGNGGFLGAKDQLKLITSPAGGATLPLAGEWLYREGVSLKNAPRVPSLRSGDQSIPTALYNGAIAPLTPFAIKGAVWYQGESNASAATRYGKTLPALITDWRARFGVGDFPFLIVQLPGFGETHADPVDTQWPRFRDVQAQIARITPNTALAVTIDLGEPKDVHPHNKLDVGRRLGLVAQDVVYGMKIESSGPVFKTMRIEAEKVCLQFNHVESLASRNGDKLAGFAIAGEDKRFVWAIATIEAGGVVLSSPQVSKPVAVRYSWDDMPSGNLINQAQLPAAPFRTDAW